MLIHSFWSDFHSLWVEICCLTYKTTLFWVVYKSFTLLGSEIFTRLHLESTLVEKMYTKINKIQKVQKSWSSEFLKTIGVNKGLGRMRRNHFTRIKAKNWGKFLLKAEKEHQIKTFFRQTRKICLGIYMQVWGNHLKNNQTQSNLMDIISLTLGYRLWFSSYLVFNIWSL